MKILIITGPPYSGKGTQCKILKDILNYVHISTGEVCRSEVSKKTKEGELLSEYEKKGNLVPDEVMKVLFGRVLDSNTKSEGVILDGYPRTKRQVEDLIELMEERKLHIEKVINIEVPKEELLKRAKKRAETSNRIDDKNENIHIKRIEIFERETRPAVKYMKEVFNVETFDGLGSISSITKEIKATIFK